MRVRPWAARTLAGQLFVTFLVASALLVGGSAWLALTQLRTALVERAHAHLEDAGRSADQALRDRLITAEAALSHAAAQAALDRPASLDAATLVSPSETRALFGSLAVPADLDVGAAGTRLVVRGESGVPEVLIAKAVDGGFVVGRVDPAYLWSLSPSLPRGTDACVYAQATRMRLHCTAPTARADAAAPSVPGSDARLSFERPLSLGGPFDAAPWLLVTSQPRSAALDALSVSSSLPVQAAALCLVLALAAATFHSRRMLKPLNQLVSAARRLAGKDLSEPLAWRRDDEFGPLGHAMNEIATSLARHRDMLAAFAEIDRLILSCRDTKHVLDAVLDRISDVVPDCDIAVLLLGPRAADRGRFYCRSVVGRPTNALVSTAVSMELRTWLVRQPEGGVHDTSEVRNRLVEYPLDRRAGRVFVMPIIHGDDLQGAVFASFRTNVDVPPARLDSLREFSSRCAVAISVAEREQRLFYRAYFDALTGLPNRTLCHDRLRQAMSVARREEHKLAVVFIDLDGFKHVNDSLGHSCGDELLRETALRLRAVLRDTDTVARLGGDEYVVILSQIHGALEAQVMADNLMEVIEAPFCIQGSMASVSASMGITIFPDDALTVEDLLRKADTAMYEAKDRGRERCVFFAQEMDERAHERLTLHTDLRSALANRELFLVYQPQVDLASGRVICAEALLRWKHPTRGFVPLASFLPVLEETGLVESIGRWVLQTALADFAQWKRRGLGVERVAVNIATRQLFDSKLVYLVDESLRQSGLSGGCLEIELTESSIVRDFVHTNEVLKSLSARGVRIAIDDFGTGYSSLEYLKDLTFDIVKIDRTFISAMHDEKAIAIIKAVTGLAHSMDKKVVAEGIESELQRRQIANLACDIGQGFLLGRPMPHGEFAEWLQSHEATLLLEEAFALRA